MNINIWLTKKCNLQCTYCYEGVTKETESMSREICNQVIAYIKKLDGEVNVRFHGGEPLLEYSNLQYLYKCLNATGKVKTFGVTTNGTLLSDEKIEFLTSAMDDFSISIDGTREVHNRNRKNAYGKGSYDEVYKIIPKVLKNKPYARARMTVTPDTVSNLYESVENVIILGFKVVAIAVDIFNQMWNEKNKNDYMAAIKLLNDKYGKQDDIHISVIEKNGIRKLASCGGGKNSVHIGTDGTCYPCGFSVGLKEFAIGNIETGIKLEMLEEIERMSHVSNPECEGCTVYDFCSGTRCKIINKIVCGTCNTPPIATCMDMNVRAKVLY